MKFADELKRIRRALRDPRGNIWSVELLMDAWNIVQDDLQLQASPLADVRTISVPPSVDASYTYEWERDYAADTALRALYDQGGYFAYTAHHEVEEYFASDGVSAIGGITPTHPWEAFTSHTPGALPEFPLPTEVGAIRGMYYDLEPIQPQEKRRIERDDPSWHTRSGDPIAYFLGPDEQRTFVPYPRPSTVVWNDEAGSGMVTSVSGDTTGAEVGVITQRTGNVLEAETGAAFEVLDADDNFLVMYDVQPRRIESLSTDISYPEFMLKYVRYGVLEHAYRANTDGNIESLADYWGQRYTLGIRALRHYRFQRSRDRERVLRSVSTPGRRGVRHPRLPDGYPPV